MFSVSLENKNGKKYIKNYRDRYRLEDEDILVAEMPEDSEDKYRFYYYVANRWVFDDIYYKNYLLEEEEKKKREEEEKKEEITNEDLMNAIMEIAMAVNDLEETIIEMSKGE